MNKLIVINSENDLEYSGFKLHKTGLEAIGDPSFDQWNECGKFIQKANGSVNLWLGDWLNYGEKKWGEKYAQAIEEVGLDYGTLRNAAYVAGKVDLSLRSDKLSYNHHLEVASLDPEQQKEVLVWAETEGATTRQTKQKVKEVKRDKLIENITEPPKYAELIHGDFREVEISEPIDAIITDPPYPGEYLPLWTDLAEFANKHLKPSGYLIAYSGQFHLPEVFERLSGKGLEYIWTICLYHEGLTQLVNFRNVICRWKPILVFQKPPVVKLDLTYQDYVISEAREKDGHQWQQSESGVSKLIETFTLPKQTVLDPFMGSGTFPFVASKLGRKAIGIEVDENSYKVAKNRREER